ncbi:unnamed protein product, partial [Mycena citricolor]
MTPATSKSNSRASRSHRRRSHKAKHGNGLFPSSQAARLHKLRSRLAPSASSQAQPQIPLNSSFLMGLSLLETQDITPDSMAQLVHEPSHISSSKYPTHLHMSAPASEDSSIEPWLGGLALLDADDITVDTMANLVDGPPPPSHSTKLRMAHQLSSSPSHHTEHPSGQTWLPALALMDADDITPDAMASLIHGASNPGSSPQAPPRKAHRRRPSRRTRSRRALAVRQAQAQPRLEQDEDSGYGAVVWSALNNEAAPLEEATHKGDPAHSCAGYQTPGRFKGKCPTVTFIFFGQISCSMICFAYAQTQEFCRPSHEPCPVWLRIIFRCGVSLSPVSYILYIHVPIMSCGRSFSRAATESCNTM